MTYSEKLKDPRWQKFAAWVKDRAGWKCELCGSSEKQLHAHHTYYEPGADPWDYDPDDLKCLCFECHNEVERVWKKVRILLHDWTPDQLNFLAVHAYCLENPEVVLKLLKDARDIADAEIDKQLETSI